MSTRVLFFFLCSLLTTLGSASDVLSVRDFGAKGDGTTDDTAAFQRALDAATKAGGGTVHAPRGTPASLSVLMPTTRFANNEREIARVLLRVRREVAATWGSS